jgi:hypothetical protein
MAFHITVVLDFPTEELMVARGLNSITQSASTASEVCADKSKSVKVD